MTAPTHVRHMKRSLKGEEHMKRNSYKEKGGGKRAQQKPEKEVKERINA